MIERVYPDIGTVTYIIKPQNKRISIKVTKTGSVQVILPRSNAIKDAEAFVLQKKTWIITHIQKPRVQPTVYTENTTNFTNQHSLQIHYHTAETIRAQIKDNCVHLHLWHQHDIASENIQFFIKKLREKVLTIEAKSYMYQRVHDLAQTHSFLYSHISISSAHTRWGSCSGKNRLSFSCYIMLLPLHLIDFIILHELCHTIHKNHGSGFHALWESLVGNKKKQYEKELKQYRII